jgi:hypothetical protein
MADLSLGSRGQFDGGCSGPGLTDQQGADPMVDQWLEYTELSATEGSPSRWRLQIRTAGVDVPQTLNRYDTREAAHAAALQASSKHNLRLKNSD